MFTLLGDFPGVVFQGCVNPLSQTSGGLDLHTEGKPALWGFGPRAPPPRSACSVSCGFNASEVSVLPRGR